MKELTNLLWEDFQQLRQLDGIHWGELPDHEGVKKLVKQLHRLVYFRGTQQELGKMIRQAYDQLMSQLEKVCPEDDTDRLCMEFLSKIPAVRAKVEKDLLAAFEGDPAATGYDEIVLAYPGLYAITVYRLAHVLFELKVPMLPRIMTEYAHSKTGIDINAGAEIGENFFIDPYGNVLPCNGMEKSCWFDTMGNLNNVETFEDIWNSEQAKAVREKVAHCPKNCWMIGSVSPVMKKYMPNILPWIVKNKLRVVMGKRVDTSCIPFYHVGNNDLQGIKE